MIYFILILFLFSILWYLYFFAYKQYVVDSTRHSLFTLRDELFDYAAKGNISFDNEAYKTTRRMINGVIRFTHDISLSNWATLALFANKDAKEYQEQFRLNFNKSIESLNTEQQEKIKEALFTAHLLIIKHLLKTSLLLIIPILILLFLNTTIKSLAKNFKSWTTIDAQANLIGSTT